MSIINNTMFTTNTQNLELPPLSAEMLWGFLIYPTVGDVVYETNLKNTASRNISPIPQSIIVDTSLMTTGDITILWDKGDLNYSIVVPYGCKNVFSVPAIADCVYSVTFSGGAVGGDVRIDLVNFPLIPQSYSVVGAATGGSISVNNFPAKQNVEGTVSVGNFPATQNVALSALAGTLLYSTVTASGTTVFDATPSNVNLRLLQVSMTGNAAMATAGILTVTIAIGNTTIAVFDFYVPAVSANIVSGIEHIRNFSFITFNTGSEADLSCELSAALTAGIISINAYFD